MLTAILEVAIIVFFAGVFTDWFGLTATSPTTAGGLQGADPNPHSEKVTSVALAMSYVGSLSGYFTIRPSGNACAQCPVLPAVDIRFGAPIADVVVYFNLTNTGSLYHEVTSWNVTTLNYAGSNPFSVRAVLCCYPAYLESAELAGLNPSQTLGFAILIQAASLPSNGGAGFSLLFTAVASD